MILLRYITLFFILFLASCGYLKVGTNSNILKDLSEKYKNKNTKQEATEDYINKFSLWYKSFNNQELDNLINLALKNNFDISKASYNLKAAAYQMGNQRVALLPSLSAKGGLTHNREGGKNIERSKNNQFTIGLAASYELDFLGKNYASYKSSLAKLEATKAENDSTQISVVSSLMNLWVNLMTIREEKALMENKLIDANNLLELQQSNYSSGTALITDVLQQKSEVLTIKTNLNNLKNSEAKTLSSINILIGKDPLDKIVINSNKLPNIDSFPSKDINIMILENRPDVRVAFYNMISSKWDQKVATLNRLPNITISTGLNWNSSSINSVLDNWLSNTVFSVAMPLFAAGSLHDKQEAAKYLSEANVVNYKAVVFNALNDFKSAFDNETSYEEDIKSLKEQVDLIKATKDELQEQYLSGDNDYLNVLISNSSLIDLQNSAIELKKKILLNRIVIYRNLGINIKVEEKGENA